MPFWYLIRVVFHTLILSFRAIWNRLSLAIATPYNEPMKYSLRSLMIAVLVGPPLLAAIWIALQIEPIRFLVVIGFATALAFLIGIGICLLVLLGGDCRESLAQLFSTRPKSA